MKGDLSSQTFRKGKRYSAVLMQQGRVQLDADTNEQQAIQRHHAETTATDVIGPTGAPKQGGGLQVVAANPQQITVPGLLLDGWKLAAGQLIRIAADDRGPLDVTVIAADEAQRRLTLSANVAAFQGAPGLRLRRQVTIE